MRTLLFIVLGAAVAVFYGLETALTFRANGMTAPVVVKAFICLAGLYLCLRNASRDAPRFFKRRIAEAPSAAEPVQTPCPFVVGDLVTFTPSERTRGHYQDIERFGVHIGQTLAITEIREGCYLYFSGDIGGWPWNEFTKATAS